MKPVNNKNDVNPLSFWHGITERFFEFLFHEWVSEQKKMSEKGIELANAVKLVAETTAITRKDNTHNVTNVIRIVHVTMRPAYVNH